MINKISWPAGRCSALRLFAVAALFFSFTLARPGLSLAIVAEPDESFRVGLALPIENNSGYGVWGSRYYPGDVLSEKMEEYFFRRLKQIPRLGAYSVSGTNPAYWSARGFSPRDMIVRINLEQFDYSKKDVLGSKVHWNVVLHMYVYNGATRDLVYESVIEQRDDRIYPLYRDILESKPIYWEDFEKSPYWPAIRRALDDAFDEVVDGYNGYRIVGQIVARAERVDGSLTVPVKKRDKIYHVNIGRNESVKDGDILAVVRSSSVRTIAPETPEMHFPQVVGRVRVLFVKEHDAVVEVVKESASAPIQLGDSVSAPLYGGRSGTREYEGRDGQLYYEHQKGF
jgi:hypothetical protein